jgi:hypothetical protein
MTKVMSSGHALLGRLLNSDHLEEALSGTSTQELPAGLPRLSVLCGASDRAKQKGPSKLQAWCGEGPV